MHTDAVVFADDLTVLWAALAVALVTGGFAFLGWQEFRKTALAIVLGEVAMTVWAFFANREADNDVDIIVTGLFLAGAVLLVVASAAGWGVGRLLRRRSAA